MVDLLILLLLQYSVSKELSRAKALVHVLVGASVNSNPCKNHDTIGDSAELRVHRARTVGVLELGNSHQCLVYGFDDALIYWQIRSGEVWLLRLCGNQEKFALLVETRFDERSLVLYHD